MNTGIGYKLFEMDTNGNLYPLFIDKYTIYPIGEWIKAKIILEHKGFAQRGGLHLGLLPAAPHLMSCNENGIGYYKGRNKGWERVWCEVEYDCTIDYNDIVSQLPKKCFVDKLPDNGWYFFKEYGKATWIISDKIKILRILSEAERQEILAKAGYDERKESIPYLNAIKKRKKMLDTISIL